MIVIKLKLITIMLKIIAIKLKIFRLSKIENNFSKS